MKWISRRSTEPLFWVRVPADAPYKNCRLESSLSIESSRGQAQFLFMRPDASRQKRVPVKLFTISWEKEQTSDSGTFASSKLPKALFVTPPRLESESVEEHNKAALKAHFRFVSSRGQANFIYIKNKKEGLKPSLFYYSSHANCECAWACVAGNAKRKRLYIVKLHIGNLFSDLFGKIQRFIFTICVSHRKFKLAVFI